MFSLILEVDKGSYDQLVYEVWEAGTSGVTEADGWVQAFFDDDTQIDELVQRFGKYRPVVAREDAERDWVQETKDRWQPFAVGERFYLVPEWRDDPAPCGRIRLRTHPGMACGTGEHPATQLCLLAMERHVEEGQSLIDVGTGSGILADAAVLLGADPVVACDIEHEASVIAAQNLRNAVRRVGVFTGSLRSVRSGSFQVVVANLNAATIGTMLADLKRVQRRGGKLILSGFREHEAPSLLKGLAERDRIVSDSWCCVVV